jgi:hypothetical protein
MNSKVRLGTGVIVGSVILYLLELLDSSYLDHYPFSLLKYLVVVIGCSMAVIIAHGNEKQSIKVGGLVVALFDIPVLAFRLLTGGVPLYIYNGTYNPTIALLPILFAVIVAIGIGAVIGWVSYKIFLEGRFKL